MSEMTSDQLDRWRALDWHLIPGAPTPPLLNMALDEVLAERVGQGERPPTLRIWGWSRPCIVLGRFQSVRNEVDEAAAERNDVQIVRRISGGGAMFIEPEGAITWSIYAPQELVKGMSFAESYAHFDSWVIAALRDLGIDAESGAFVKGGTFHPQAKLRRSIGGIALFEQIHRIFGRKCDDNDVVFHYLAGSNCEQ